MLVREEGGGGGGAELVPEGGISYEWGSPPSPPPPPPPQAYARSIGLLCTCTYKVTSAASICMQHRILSDQHIFACNTGAGTGISKEGGVRYDIEGMSHYSLGVWGSASSTPIGVWGSAPEAITFYVIQTYKKSL